MDLTQRNVFAFSILAATFLAGCQGSAPTAGAADQPAEFSFAITSDMRQYTAPAHPGPQYFEGVCSALKDVGAGDFMVCPGDIDPIPPVRATLDRVLGTNYLWYPVVGNHEAETPEDLAWLRAWSDRPIPGLVRRGPPNCVATCYSFDHGPAHFAMINQYCDGQSEHGTSGDVLEPVHDWLANDLAANQKPVVFVVAHEPIVSVPDMDTGRMRHKGDALDAHPATAKRFLDLLRQYHVTAYLTSHTHNASVTNLGGVWQVDSGHARGLGDKGAPSTFMKVAVNRAGARIDVYRADAKGENYALRKSVDLR
jgi:hypothetical protein